MALSSANRNFLHINQGNMMLLMATLIDQGVEEKTAINLALIQKTMKAEHGIDSSDVDDLITYYDTLGALMDS